MRLFIAINFNTETQAHLLSLRNELRSHAQHGRFSAPENLHLTLVFLGECDLEQTAAAQEVMAAICFEPFDIAIECVGRFKKEVGDVWWVGVRASKELLDLQHRLSEKLVTAGFALESRRYSPHITLGREVVTAYDLGRIESFGETVYAIDLMKSERIGGKLTYTSIFRRGKWAKPIVVKPYHPQWRVEFERLKAYLLPAIDDIAVDVHHVGSTSVQGLAAKPILDVDIEIKSMDSFPKIIDRLATLGYRHVGDYGITGREVFKYDTTDFMEHHLYVCPSDSPELNRHLIFRNYLRENASAIQEYGKLKISLAAKCGNDIDAYINGKSGFIAECLVKAANI